ncbi:MAG: hypothetical protein ACE5KA_02055 [Nitrososphaerales archaeon]
MSLEVTCGKCGAIIYTMRILKPIKDVLRASNNKCPSCGNTLSATDFTVSVNRI